MSIEQAAEKKQQEVLDICGFRVIVAHELEKILQNYLQFVDCTYNEFFVASYIEYSKISGKTSYPASEVIAGLKVCYLAMARH